MQMNLPDYIEALYPVSGGASFCMRSLTTE